MYSEEWRKISIQYAGAWSSASSVQVFWIDLEWEDVFVKVSIKDVLKRSVCLIIAVSFMCQCMSGFVFAAEDETQVREESTGAEIEQFDGRAGAGIKLDLTDSSAVGEDRGELLYQILVQGSRFEWKTRNGLALLSFYGCDQDGKVIMGSRKIVISKSNGIANASYEEKTEEELYSYVDLEDFYKIIALSSKMPKWVWYGDIWAGKAVTKGFQGLTDIWGKWKFNKVTTVVSGYWLLNVDSNGDYKPLDPDTFGQVEMTQALFSPEGCNITIVKGRNDECTGFLTLDHQLWSGQFVVKPAKGKTSVVKPEVESTLEGLETEINSIDFSDTVTNRSKVLIETYLEQNTGGVSIGWSDNFTVGGNLDRNIKECVIADKRDVYDTDPAPTVINGFFGMKVTYDYGESKAALEVTGIKGSDIKLNSFVDAVLKDCNSDEKFDSVLNGYKNYPRLRALLSEYYNFNKDMKKLLSTADDGDASKSLTGKDYSGSSEYEKWAAVMTNYVLTGKLQFEEDQAGLNADDYNLAKFSSAKELTDEQRLNLRAWFTVVATQNGRSCPSWSTGGGLQPYYATWFNLGDLEGKTVAFNSGGLEADEVKEVADTIAETLNLSEGITDTSENRVAIMDSLVKYYSARMYGFAEEDLVTSNALNEFSVVGDNGIKLPNGVSRKYDYSAFWYGGFKSLQRMKGVLGSSESAYLGYMNVMYNLDVAYDWADVFYSNGDDGTGYKALSGFLNSTNPEEITSEDVTEDISSYIVKCLAICRSLEYLGVEPWSEALEKIQGLYSKLAEFENVVQIHDNANSESESLGMFFNIDGNYFTDDYITGVALSATYVPFQTNLYDLSSVAYLNSENIDWVSRFHYPFGFYRKALYIDSAVDAAVNRYVTGETSNKLEIATLEDLFETEKDIVLYVDTNFYNAEALVSARQAAGYAVHSATAAETSEENEPVEGVSDAVSNIAESVTGKIEQMLSIEIDPILKTSGYTSYSENVRRKAKGNYGDNSEEGADYVFTDEYIDKYLRVYEEESDASKLVFNSYTVLQPFAVVSAIYRQKSLFNLLKTPVRKNDPVFVSSPNLAGTVGVSQEEFNSVYNYAMLKNLESALPVNADITLDRDSPLFMDIYGNIVTESGYVVIPAASNATLCSGSYTPVSAGFLSLYSRGEYEIPADYNNASDFISSYFEVNEETGTFVLTAKLVDGAYVDFSKFQLSDGSSLQWLRDFVTEECYNRSSYLPFSRRAYLITEVLRGAPLNNIDYEAEGIKDYRDVNKVGVYFASKLEDLSSALLSKTNGNSLVKLPNLAFMEGVEYVILFLFKIIFAGCLVLLFYRMYVDAVQGILGIKTLASFVISIFMFLVVAFAIPETLDISYYQVNKRLLQSEVEYIEMLNLEKAAAGREIGIADVTAPETETKLYLKVDDLSIPWYTILDDVLFKSTFKTVGEIYDDALDDSLLANLPGFVKKGDGLYVSVTDLFESSVVEYDSSSNELVSVVTKTPYASYVTPYYAILDLLVERVNIYNQSFEVQAFTTTVQSGGRVRTVGAVADFFTSNYFMAESQDVLGLKGIYNVESTLVEASPFSSEDIERMSYSMWYDTTLSKSELERVINEIDKKARLFVVNNRQLIGKISDETFLKVMALSMAVEHNDAMNIPAANAIEIYDVDTRDLLRLSLADKTVVMKECSKSYARFVFDSAGVLGVVIVAFLLVIYFIASFIKPVMIFIILASMIAAVFRRTIRKEEGGSIEGVVITLSLVCGVNILYALMLKCTMFIPDLGVTMTVSCFLQILIQLAYLFLLGGLTGIVLSDWQDVGMNTYSRIVYKVMVNTRSSVSNVKNAVIKSRYTASDGNGSDRRRIRRNREKEVRKQTVSEETGGDILNRMLDEDQERKER